MGDDQQMRNWLLFVALFSSLVYSSYSYEFVVGGRDGWVVKPSENYNQWASRMRFQVNDTLRQPLSLSLFQFAIFVTYKNVCNWLIYWFAVFKYKSGSDSVLVVNKDAYDRCSVANPLLKLDDGNSIFKFNRSGPFYFISGNKANCDQGQKLIVVVLAVRSPPSPLPPNVPPPAAAPSPGPGAPTSQPGGAPAPANSPLAPSPAGSGSAPEGSPSSSMPPGSSMPGSPGASVPGSPQSSTPGGGTPADANSPPRSLAAPPCSSSVYLVSVLSVGLGVFVFSPLNI